MIDPKYKEIIDKLISRTRQKKISWEKTERDAEFKTVLGSSTVTTDHWLLETGNMCVDLALWNRNEDIAGRIAYENNDKEGEDYKSLMELYNLVKDSYYLVDETFDEILSKLNSED